MLQRTFMHIQGIGEKTEKRIWSKGIATWQDFLDWPGPVFSPGRDRVIRAALEESLVHLDDPAYFKKLLPSNQAWRMYRRFKGKTAFLDIETSGLDQDMHEITVIGVYDGQKVFSYVNGFNLPDFEIDIAEYDMVITFNGAMFDLPFIRRSFPSITLPEGHIDLMHALRKLGYRGGLKKIEKDLGISRGEDIDGLGGYEAVLLWRDWRNGDKAALDRLIAYNTADIVNLKPLMELAYDRLSSQTLAPIQ
ncbi:ribonuclease H-like domain-containing protein [Desulfatibacillum aliphaticivorans]|uniref:ribonuclease H-like domain-containing protein n=1 Tax=Desulfatibacillum aliphaticivorans TaxID=218208 RepID=UPI000423512A|nr:ribonuclease H-like domain-containing protein [Desulfatibacillum aliphaticivorans]